MVAGSVHETMEERTQRRRQALLLARYVCSTTDGGTSAAHVGSNKTKQHTAGVTHSLSTDDVGTNALHASGAGGDSLARQQTRKLTKYFCSLRSTYQRGLDDILGRRSSGDDDEDWEILVMVEEMKNSVPKPNSTKRK